MESNCTQVQGVINSADSHPKAEAFLAVETPVSSCTPVVEKPKASQSMRVPALPPQESPTGEAMPRAADDAFVHLHDGLHHIKQVDNQRFVSTRVCSPICVLARTRDENGESWGKLVEVVDPEGRKHEINLSAQHHRNPKGKYLDMLASLGLRIEQNSSCALLHRYISTAEGDGLMRSFSRFGWHNASTFVLPDAAYGLPLDERMLLHKGQSRYPFATQGSLEDWQRNVGDRCRGNSRLILSTCIALAGPLLQPLGLESGGFNLFGESSTGKTTTLKVAGSVCGGGPGGYIYQWRATDNSIESIAAKHNDSLLCLDEMGQADPDVIARVAYMLGNGKGKSRSSRDGRSHSIQTWRVILLSTSERPMAHILNEGRGQRLRTGHLVRIVDVPADAGKEIGIFEELHGHASPGNLANALQTATSQYFGTPLRVFLEMLVGNPAAAVSRAQEIMDRFRAQVQGQELGSAEQRVCRRFELLAAAGSLAADCNILPWPAEESLAAVERCFHHWLDSASEQGTSGFSNEIRLIRKYLTENATRFVDLDTQSAPSGQEDTGAGYFKTVDGQRLCLIKQEVLENEVFNGRPAQRIYNALSERGISQAEKSGKSSSRASTTQNRRVIALSTSALGLTKPAALTVTDHTP